jgi:hypothetical protein
MLGKLTSIYPPSTPHRNLIIATLINEFLTINEANKELTDIMVPMPVKIPRWSTQTPYLKTDIALILNQGSFESLDVKLNYFINRAITLHQRQDDMYSRHVSAEYNLDLILILDFHAVW